MALILNLDDEKHLLDINQHFLKDTGHKFMGVTNSHEALRLLRFEPIDLFIQDLCRPDISGKELYKTLKADAKLRHIPVLIISGNDDARLRISVELLCSKDEFLKKPYCPEHFIAKITKLLMRPRFEF